MASEPRARLNAGRGRDSPRAAPWPPPDWAYQNASRHEAIWSAPALRSARARDKVALARFLIVPWLHVGGSERDSDCAGGRRERGRRAARVALPTARARAHSSAQTVRAHWKTFLAEVEERGEGGASLPRFVVGEFERYLACGILAHGFARVRCAACGDELLVALSCKGRGFCPSCTTRRMHDTAAHLRWRA